MRPMRSGRGQAVDGFGKELARPGGLWLNFEYIS
jgi:hypothetical protein